MDKLISSNITRNFIVVLGLSLLIFSCSTAAAPPPPPGTIANIPPDTDDQFALTGGIYYVANNGSDTNTGTQGSPWKTLQYAANQVKAGDTVLVQNGDYEGFYTVFSGAKNNPIVFKANGESVVISSGWLGGTNPDSNKTINNINIEGTDFIVIDGFVVKDAKKAGIRIVESSEVIVKNNRVGPSEMWGIFTGFAPSVKIRNNKTFRSRREHGIYVSNSRISGDNPVVRGNESYGNNFNGIQFNGDCGSGGDGIISGALIEGNILRDNRSKAFSLISMQESVVRNNLIYNNGIVNGAGGIHLTDEISADCNKPSNNNVIVNNTVIEPRIAGIRITDNAKGNVIFNNLIITQNSPPIADEVGGGQNQIDTASNLTLRGAIPANFFIDASQNNYHLKSGSPAIDAGKATYQAKVAPAIDFEGISIPQGTRIDQGAFEYK
ncbi:MAG: right-handed parallel beta-helix repeat-containing protein [Nitrospirota bacterium]